MVVHLMRDIENLRGRILGLGSMVEQSVTNAVQSLLDRNNDLAREVMEGDDKIDEAEVAIEEDCLKILALHQPVATDLRFIVMVLKVNNDLERIGDLASNIAARVADMAPLPVLDADIHLPEMAVAVRQMIRDSLQSMIHRDMDLAHEVCEADRRVDEIHRNSFAVLEESMHRDPECIHQAVLLLSVCRYLERMADLATNIAEDVIFHVSGSVVRHSGLA
ncbi:MAG TPA: phosphate signaling complex protein PhoU [Planctomycetes bacterium]|nr:phosphate signaling complex protein PhoU [Planctomycetota bacterium]